MHTPSFDVKILVEKVRIICGYLRYLPTYPQSSQQKFQSTFFPVGWTNQNWVLFKGNEKLIHFEQTLLTLLGGKKNYGLKKETSFQICGGVCLWC